MCADWVPGTLTLAAADADISAAARQVNSDLLDQMQQQQQQQRGSNSTGIGAGAVDSQALLAAVRCARWLIPMARCMCLCPLFVAQPPSGVQGWLSQRSLFLHISYIGCLPACPPARLPACPPACLQQAAGG